jgi:hypothetical protein
MLDLQIVFLSLWFVTLFAGIGFMVAGVINKNQKKMNMGTIIILVSLAFSLALLYV